MKTLQLRDKAPTTPAALAAAGVPFAISSEGLEAPKDVIKALKKSIDVGLKPADAIRALTLSAAPFRMRRPFRSTPLMRVCAVNGTKVACGSATSRPRSWNLSLASVTILRPSGVSSASENLTVTKGDLFDDKATVAMIFIDGKKYLPAPEEPTPPRPSGGAPTEEVRQ